MSSELGPDFFVVGAPKCGTTSLNAYLARHPHVFMAPKELHHFGSDLPEHWNHPGSGGRWTTDAYFSLFADSGWAVRRGDTSAAYLCSRRAAEEIHQYRPEARIIAMIRNPVDVIPSLHSQYLYDELEDLGDLRMALAAEPDRREGRRIPPNNGPNPWRLLYREMVSFSKQLERYFHVFGREQVHVVLFDDFASDTHAAYRSVLEFLDLDPSFVPALPVLNANKRYRSRMLKRVLLELRTPPSITWRVGTALAPAETQRRAALRGVADGVSRLNTNGSAREPIAPELRAKLSFELADEIRRLEQLLDRDLTHWHSSNPLTQSLGGARQTVVSRTL